MKRRGKAFGDRRLPFGNWQSVQTTAQQQRDGTGVLQGRVRREFRGQHHTAHIVSAQGVHGNRRHKGAVDTSRKAQQHPFEPGFAHVIAQALDHNAVVLFPHVRHRGQIALHRPPAFISILKIHVADAGVKGGHLQHQLSAGVQNKRSPVKHLIVLPADHVQIDQWQAGFHHL